MSHQERESVVSFIANMLVSVPYLLYIISRYQSETFSGNEELQFWASAILILIPVRIVLHILIYILFSIITTIVTNQQEPSSLTDERDKLIGLKATRNSYYASSVGLLFGIIALASGSTISVFFIILIIGGIFAEVVEHTSQIIFYRRGY